MKQAFLFMAAVMFSSMAFANGNKIDSTLLEYTGKYIFQAGAPTPEAQVGYDQGALFISSEIGASTLARIEGDKFSLVEYGGTAEFSRNDKGKVVKIRVIVQDIDATGTKEGEQLKLSIHPLRMIPRMERLVTHSFEINLQ